MTHLVEPLVAALDNDDGPDVNDTELASLVRRWVGARRPQVVRVASTPAPDDAEDHGDTGSGSGSDLVVAAEPGLTTAAESPAAEPSDRAAPGAGDERAPRMPVLPHRQVVQDAEHVTRLAVLIDARRVAEDVAAGLLARLGERGSVNVCRAYADWRRTDLGTWVERLRQQGLHSFHQFADDDDQALVALAIDAVDVAREASVDEVVLAGDTTSMLPLVHRLHGAGVRVVVVGAGHTPHDVRAACDEFIGTDSLVGRPTTPAGRHRA